MKWLKGILIFLGGMILFVAGAGYCGGNWYFQNHFLPGTEVAGFNVSFKTAEETENLLNQEILSYALAVDTRNGGREKLTAEQVGMQYHSTGEVRELLKSQPYKKWMLAKGKSYSLTGGFKIDRKKFDEAVKGLKCANNMQAPVDARILKVDDKYQIIPEVNGTQLDLDQAKGLIETALKRGDVSVSLEKCYKNPMKKSDDPELIRKCNILNKMQQTIITYDFKDRSEYIDSNIAEEWIVDNDLSKTAVYDYVRQLAQKYDTVGSERTFITYDDREIPLVGGEYGWKIDVNKEAEKLYELIINGEVTVREPEYSKKALCRERNDIGYNYIEIDTTASKIVLYIDGNPVIEDTILYTQNLPSGCNYLLNKNETAGEQKYLLSGTQNINISGLTTEKEALLRIQLTNGYITDMGEYPLCILSENSANALYQTVPDNCPIIIY